MRNARRPSDSIDQRPTLGGAISGLVSRVLAKPPVRKIARDLGIDLSDVIPTGARGEVTREDLVSYKAQRDAEVDKADTFWGKTAVRRNSGSNGSRSRASGRPPRGPWSSLPSPPRT